MKALWIDLDVEKVRRIRQRRIKEARWNSLSVREQNEIVQLQLRENWYLNRRKQ